MKARCGRCGKTKGLRAHNVVPVGGGLAVGSLVLCINCEIEAKEAIRQRGGVQVTIVSVGSAGRPDSTRRDSRRPRGR